MRGPGYPYAMYIFSRCQIRKCKVYHQTLLSTASVMSLPPQITKHELRISEVDRSTANAHAKIKINTASVAADDRAMT